MNYGIYIRASGQDLGVNRVLEVSAAATIQYLAIPPDQLDVLSTGVIETPVWGLEPSASAFGITGRDVTPDKVPLPLGPQHTTHASHRSL